MTASIEMSTANTGHSALPNYLIGRVITLFATWKAHRQNRKLIESLRKYDRHLLNDMEIEEASLWQAPASIRLLQTPFILAASVGDRQATTENRI